MNRVIETKFYDTDAPTNVYMKRDKEDPKRRI